ncbi:MAG TPA: hexitol phosphatase HxpB [Flavobacteriales bacterium]|nr:hexitol phosphatase HxpB [Flavobacteriales bacterium]HRJ36722.1 hexitol phosphatase HxpB [Flavobacteriales bacterium]HRJ37773.1 hexitol phosphatase HxpB [Flavobacteriales bacterium]
MIKAVIFDMDGLLIDSEPIWREAEKEVFATVGISLSDEMCFETVGLRIEEVVDHWHRQFPWSNRSKEEIAIQVVQRVTELIREKGKALPGVQRAIQSLHKENIPLAIASGSHYSIIHTVVDQLNIRSYFSIIHSAEEEEHGKPHPAIFLSTAKRLNVYPTECLVFEDSFNGVIAAKAARMKVIAVPEDIHRGEQRFHAADLILETLEDFSPEQLLKW